MAVLYLILFLIKVASVLPTVAISGSVAVMRAKPLWIIGVLAL